MVERSGEFKGAKDMSNRVYRNSFVIALSGAWLLLFTVGALGQEAPAPPSPSEAAQPNAAVVQSLSEFLKAQAARSEEATKLERDVIQRTLNLFTWIVGVVGGLLVAGAALLGWFIRAWNRANKTDIQLEVKKQLRSDVVEEIGKEIEATRNRIGKLGQDAAQLGKEFEKARDRVAGTEDQLKEQGENITKLFALALGSYPYDYLKSIYDKKTGRDSNREFKLQPGASFKREMNFLIDLGYLENVDLSKFPDNSNILDELTITEAGESYIKFREKLPARALEQVQQKGPVEAMQAAASGAGS
jgi:hypothetical protein